MADDERAFASLPINRRPGKPRTRGVTAIRGPYYTPMGKHYLQDILETMAGYVDALKFAGGSFCLMPRPVVKELIALCHAHDVLVSTGGFIEHVLTLGPEAVHEHTLVPNGGAASGVRASAARKSSGPPD